MRSRFRGFLLYMVQRSESLLADRKRWQRKKTDRPMMSYPGGSTRASRDQKVVLHNDGRNESRERWSGTQ